MTVEGVLAGLGLVQGLLSDGEDLVQQVRDVLVSLWRWTGWRWGWLMHWLVLLQGMLLLLIQLLLLQWMLLRHESMIIVRWIHDAGFGKGNAAREILRPCGLINNLAANDFLIRC